MLPRLEDIPVGRVESHFLDSGAFTLWTRADVWAKENNKSCWDFYDTEEFWAYMNGYIAFVKKYKKGIDLYANVDAIPNPEITWRNQQYMEAEGLHPVPVVHFRTDLRRWLVHYMDRGYGLIGLGGLVGSTSQDGCRAWIDRAFDIVCDCESRLPKVKLHGFGITSYDLIIRYPWASIDSTSWTKVGAYGGIMVPHKRKGQFIFDEAPYVMKVSNDSPDRSNKGRHVINLSPKEKGIIQEWLDCIGIPMGKMDEAGEVLEYGVTTRHSERKAANLLFFEAMRQSLPDYPWPFRSTRRQGFGFF